MNLSIEPHKRESLDSSQPNTGMQAEQLTTAQTTDSNTQASHTHNKSTRALIGFYLNLYRANMERMQPYLTMDSEQSRSIVENAANNIMRIQARLDELGGAK